jgi:hypothetical protein
MALFTLNQTSKLATHAQYIRKTGAHPCKILSASVHLNEKKGSESIKFEVESKDGKKANFYICISSPKFDASQIERAYAEVNSIMLCTGIQTMDSDKNGIYQPLCNKEIGIVFQMEEGLYNGAVPTNPTYRMCFFVATGQTAQEKRDNAQAVELNRYLATLAPVIALKNPVQPAVNHAMPLMQTGNAPSQPVGNDDFDSDVPFN